MSNHDDLLREADDALKYSPAGTMPEIAKLLTSLSAAIRELRAAVLAEGGAREAIGLTPCGFGDDDERWGETVVEYVDGCVDSHDYDDIISGEPFTVTAQFYREEQWRTVSTAPMKCERVDVAPIAPPPAGYKEINEYIAEIERDPKRKAALDRARERIKGSVGPADGATTPSFLEMVKGALEAKPLDPEFAKVLRDNLWSLYEGATTQNAAGQEVVGELVDVGDDTHTLICEWTELRYRLPVGTKLYATAASPPLPGLERAALDEKDRMVVYESANHVGIPAEQIDRWLGTMKMCGFEISRMKGEGSGE